MKVYGSPIPFEHDFSSFDTKREEARIAQHQVDLRQWLAQNGFTGTHSGKTISFGVADGRAEYMLAEGRGKTSYLIHLPYWDAYQYRDVQFLPKKEILGRITQQESYREAFGHD